MELSHSYVRQVLLAASILSLSIGGLAQSRNCLRVMPADELTRSAALIARVKVVKTERVSYEGIYTQLATLAPLEVIEGDFTLKKVFVFARSNFRCAEDNYVEGQEMLVFLVPERSLYHTLNFQYGQFLVSNDVVKGWRNKANNQIDKIYSDVRQEIEGYLTKTPAKPQETVPAESANKENPRKPPEPITAPDSKAQLKKNSSHEQAEVKGESKTESKGDASQAKRSDPIPPES